ncbi:MAG: hypothetical protein ACFFAN_04575 [Promethearchaeota archaeon]
MSKKTEESDSNRTKELPKSLQGIEIILLYLNEKDKKSSSIRNISNSTGISMRVVKNILLQLEKFNQVERVVEKTNILPKWRITKFGKKVINEAKVTKKKKVDFPSKSQELIYNISIPETIEKLKEQSKEKQDECSSKLNDFQIEFSKTLGPILNINNPAFEDLLSFILKRVKFLKQKLSLLPSDPLKSYSLRKKGEKEKKVSKEQEKLLLIEIFFLNSLISNELKLIEDINSRLSKLIETRAFSRAYSSAKDLREEIRILTTLISNRESISVNKHLFSIEVLKQISKNKINNDILDDIIDLSISEEEQLKEVEELILKFISKLNKDDTQFNNHSAEITENIPLFALYQLMLDEKPNLNLNIEQLEKSINLLADEGYIPGIKIIQEDEDHYLKVVQLKAHDISQEEIKVISKALSLEQFTLGDIVELTGWNPEKVIEILNKLTKLGILKYSKSFLHGERWYIISDNNKIK